MTLMIDNRKGSVELASLIQGRVPSEVTRLEFADYSWIGNSPEGPAGIGVERKTISDLVSSMVSGRLSGHQMIGMLSSFSYVFLLVEENFRPGKTGILEIQRRRWAPLQQGTRRYMYRDIVNYLNTLIVACGVNVWRTNSPVETADWLCSTYLWWQKDWKRHSSHTQFNVSNLDGAAMLRRPSLLHRMIKEIDGVGWRKGKLIARRFKTMPEIMSATVRDLMEVEGIGKVLAEKIHNQLRGG